MTNRLLPLSSLILICTVVPAQQESRETWIGLPEALVLDGIPKLPAALAEAAGLYAENRSAFPADWHPVRREMLIGTRFGNTIQTHLVKMPGGARQQLTFFNEPKKKDPAAVALGRKGGKATAKGLTAEERTAFAQKSAAAPGRRPEARTL
jgi:hypothetical protein